MSGIDTTIIQDDTNMEGCSSHKDEEIPTFSKDYSEYKPKLPPQYTLYENKKDSNNHDSNSIENKQTDEQTNKMDEECDNSYNLPKQNLLDISNNCITETSKNEKDFLYNLKINEINAISKNKTECLKDKNELNKKETINKSPIFRVIYDYKHNLNINVIIKDEFDGVLFYLAIGLDLIYNKGRIPNILKKMIGAKGKHDNTYMDNAIKCVLTSIKESIDAFVKSLCLNDPFGTEIQSLTIQPQMGSKKEDYIIFFDKKLINIYFDAIPKNLGKFLNEERKEKKEKGENFINEHNISTIKNVCVRESANKNKEVKIIKTLFNEVSFGDMLEAYFDKSQQYIKKGDVSIDLNNFKRYEDCLNKIYNQETKEKLKNKILKLMSDKKMKQEN